MSTIYKALITISFLGYLPLFSASVLAEDSFQIVYNGISEPTLASHIKTLSSDRFQGRASGQSGEALALQYLTNEFKKFGLEPGNGDSYLQKVQFKTKNHSGQTKQVTSYNVIATLPGFENHDEHLIYSSHWDHLGVDTNKKGDKIYNGAQDNASGIAGLLELARAFSELTLRPSRSVTFIAFTGYEQAFAGSDFYMIHPIIPINKTIANITVEGLNILGKVKEIAVVGLGQSELDQYLEQIAKKQNRFIINDTNRPAGYATASDHLNFANAGIPSIWAGGGVTAIDPQTDIYRKNMTVILDACHRQVCDQFRRNWNLSGAQQDLQLFFELGYKLLNSEHWPNWSEAAKFNRQTPIAAFR